MGGGFSVLGSGNGVQIYGDCLRVRLNDGLLGSFMFTALLSQQSSDFFFFCPRPKINWGILQFLRSF